MSADQEFQTVASGSLLCRGGLGRWLAVAGLLLCGCNSARVYTAATLPASLHARPMPNVRTVALTKLASDSQPIDEVNAGDQIGINIAPGLSAQDNMSLVVRVNDDGTASLPGVGRLRLQGLTLEECEAQIRGACIQRQIYRDPLVSVAFKQRKTVQVMVVGAVEKEGTYQLASGGAGLLQAISLAGGFSEDAGTLVEVRYPSREVVDREKLIAQLGDPSLIPDTDDPKTAMALIGRQVPVRTEPPKIAKIDLASFSDEEPRQLQLLDQAVVMVERRDVPPLQVGGLVEKPGTYDYPPGKELRLLAAIDMAGGASSLAADKVYVIRHRPGDRNPALIEGSIRKAKRDGTENMLLEPGDKVSVEQTPATVLLEGLRMIGFNLSARAL